MRFIRQRRLIWCVLFLFGLLTFVVLGGCGSDDDDDQMVDEPEVEVPVPQPPTVTAADVVMTNADIAFAGYSDALDTAMELQTAVDMLVANPTTTTFQAAKDAWRKAREAYQPTEVYRFRPGPIEDLMDDGTLERDEGPEARINGWPLGEALIDYVAMGEPDGDAGDEESVNAAGLSYPMNLISDTSIDVGDKDTIREYVEFMDDRNVGTGYHAVEFLLWGQDLNGGESMWTSPRDGTAGQRPVSDYYQNNMCTSGTNSSPAQICMRRAMYLQNATELLVDDLQAIVDAWDPNMSGSFYHTYVADQDSLARILESMARMAFGELAGERMNIALLDNSQEDEHSCFSDNTHRDILLNVIGVKYQFLGEYDLPAYALAEFMFDDTMMITGRGHGVYDLLMAEGHADEAEALNAAIGEAVSLAMVIDTKARNGVPFDQQIEDSAHHSDITSTISALGRVVVAIEAAIEALNLDIASDDLLQDTCEEIDERRGTAEDCPEI